MPGTGAGFVSSSQLPVKGFAIADVLKRIRAVHVNAMEGQIPVEPVANMSKIARSVKNVTKGYSQVEVKVRNATSNDPWGPVGSDMAEIAQITFNSSTDFYQVMDMLDKRLNDRGKNWRHVLKSLKVLDYCLHEGSELVVTWARKNIYIIKTLREFQHTDEDGRDVGQNVRMAAKELTSLILDEERLRAERADRKSWKSRVTGIEEYPGGGHRGLDNGDGRHARNGDPRRSRRTEEEDLELRLALEASKNEAEEERKRRERTSRAEETDDDLEKAIKLSKEEEELRRKELEQTNADLLFGETTVQPTAYQPTGNNQGYQQQGQVDWFGNLSFNRPQPTQTFTQPTLNTLSEQKTAQPQFSNTSFTTPAAFSPQQTAQPQQPKNEMDPHAARLNALLATGEGQDTFGNVGNMRIPAQHTAPGTFVNSAGAGLNRINANATGNNPFLNSQFTGMPQQNRIMPAQTGPASNFGANPYGNANPFGAQPQQQQNRQPGSNNLIDL
ncbi:eh domain binding epsin 2 [Pyrenophora seminiperda CCB06]|uniref:Eh domain binding epsin 2 n=1 Tax=Pyrenophora seminiperda CCB06 TaxID=1302712 RepID=A0A3M7MK89_9PLEO|nr:eh domain binding epsin 2 [Pyrenophora seminiperda CCB06]